MHDDLLIVDTPESVPATESHAGGRWARFGLLAGGAALAAASLVGVASAAQQPALDVDLDLEEALGDQLTDEEVALVVAVFGDRLTADHIRAATGEELLQRAIDFDFTTDQIAALLILLDEAADDETVTTTVTGTTVVTGATGVTAATGDTADTLDVELVLGASLGDMLTDAEAERLAAFFQERGVPTTAADVRGLTVAGVLNRALTANFTAAQVADLLDRLDDVVDDATTADTGVTATTADTAATGATANT